MLEFAPKIDMFQAMERRENHKFFKDSTPKKEDIEAILKKAIELTPVKNSNYDFKVEVYGPEFHAKKRDLLPHTLHHLVDTSFQLNKINYAEADEITRGLLTSDLPFHTEGKDKYFSFNPQVLAPYLLVFKYSEFQSKTDQERIKNNTPSTDDTWLERSAGYQMNYLAASAMYAYVISVLANSYELDAAFCQCFGYVQDRTAIPLLGDSRHTGFMLGIGTYDRESIRIPKPSVESIVEWQKMASQLGPDEETYAIAVNNKVEEIINKLLITNGEVDSAKRVTELKSTVNNITVKGLSAIPTFLSQDSKYLNASNLILTNKESIVEEAMTWFNTTHPNVHTEIQIQKCSRDTGYNIDALVTDLQNGGNFETIAVATRYWEGTSVN